MSIYIDNVNYFVDKVRNIVVFIVFRAYVMRYYTC